jgi:hypothetical protein
LLQISISLNSLNLPNACAVTPFLGGLAFFLVIGSLIIKTWRLNEVFHASTKSKTALTPTRFLVLAVSFLYLIDLILSAVWVGISPPSIKRNLGLQEYSFVYKCGSDSDTLYFVVVAWRALILIATAVLVFRSRTLPEAFNEKKSVAFLVYNMTFLGLIFLILRSFLQKTSDFDLIVQVLFISVPLYAALGIWIGVKFYLLKTKTEESLKDEIDEQIAKHSGGSSGLQKFSRRETYKLRNPSKKFVWKSIKEGNQEDQCHRRRESSLANAGKTFESQSWCSLTPKLKYMKTILLKKLDKLFEGMLADIELVDRSC